MAETPDTDNYGFTRVGESETLSKNGFAALDGDRIVLDDLLFALERHTHTGESRLPDPVGTPSLIASTAGGVLPPGVTLYYRIAYLDRWGLETGASSEAAVTTSGLIGSPEGIAATIETSTGTLGPGLYSYTSTFVTSTGGETEPSPRTDIRISEGTTNRMRLDLPDLVPGTVAIRVYRARPGQSQFYFLTEGGADIVYDDGLVEDVTVTLPGFNTTNATNSIEVSVPGGVLPQGVFGWKLYRSVEPSTYSGFNLVHVVVEPTTESSTDVRTSWIDTGGALQRGEPRQVSATVSGGEVVSLEGITGRLPLSAMARGSRQWDPFMPGVLTVDKEYSRFTSPVPIQPSQISAFFLSAPVTTPTGAQMGVRITDEDGNFVELSTHRGVSGSNEQYYLRSLPLTDSGTLEAEDGDNTAPIVTDITGTNGQAVEIELVGQYSQVSLGVLDRGHYQGFVSIRYAADTGNVGPVADVSLSALSIAATPTTLAEAEHTVVRQGASSTPAAVLDSYYELPALPFFAPGGQEVVLRLTKGTSEVASYRVDNFRYTAETTELVAGEISLTATVADLPDQSYTQAVPAGTSYWWFTPNYVILSAPNKLTATVVLSTSDMVADTYSLTSSEPWLTATPASSTATTQTVTLTLDPSFLSPGDRSVATLTCAGTTHTSTAISVIALIPPAATGADVNVSVAY